MLTIDVTANTNSWRLRHPAEKVIPALALLTIVVTQPPVPASLGVFALVTATAIVGADIAWRVWVRALALPTVFILTGVVGIALVTGNGPGPLPLTITEQSARRAGSTLGRSLAGVSTVLLIGMTTPMIDLIALLRLVRVPVVVTDLMMTIYRLVFDLVESGRRLRTSQAARLGHDGLARSLRSTALLVSAVFVQSVHRARRLQIGLDARAYDGELRVVGEPKPFRPGGLVAGAFAVCVVLAFSILGQR